MILLELFYTFFIIGLFGFGGGYGMLTLIQTETVLHHHWLSSAQFTNIVAISQMTPGPIGINSATYCGFTAMQNAHYGMGMSVLGSAISTFALVLPSFILMILEILDQRCHLRGYILRNKGNEDQSHTNDLLCRLRRIITPILIIRL